MGFLYVGLDISCIQPQQQQQQHSSSTSTTNNKQPTNSQVNCMLHAVSDYYKCLENLDKVSVEFYISIAEDVNLNKTISIRVWKKENSTYKSIRFDPNVVVGYERRGEVETLFAL